MAHPPTIVIAGTSSGVGKTSITLGLARALKRRGVKVQPLKVGPDYLDPTHLSLAAGRQCYNLDSWMTSPEYVRALAARLGRQSDLCLIEGVMGLYDGAYPDRLTGSTAEIAMLLGAPVLLVCDAHGAARSLAAMAKGYAEFEPGVRVGGILANHVGSEGHVRLLRTCLESANQPRLIGAVARNAFPEIESRHLGLVTANQDLEGSGLFDALADAVESSVDLDAVLQLAQTAQPPPEPMTTACEPVGEATAVGTARIGIASDEAFHFYYPDNLEMLEAAGAQLVPFSPVHDRGLPPGLDGLILGGGYPEEFGTELAANTSMREAVRQFASTGGVVHAECGGLMYLGRQLEDRDGQGHAMCGVLPLETRMLSRRTTLGYVEATLARDSCLGPRGTALRGHEFHYSELVAAEPVESPPFLKNRRRNATEEPCGFACANVIASYIHVHFGSCPAMPRNLVRACIATRQRKPNSACTEGMGP
jgi:cobyrinic acid a,c-diamide synthase